MSLDLSPLTSLTTSEFTTLQRLWRLAELPPTHGYATAVVAIVAASDHSLAAILAVVDFDDAHSVAFALEALRNGHSDFRHLVTS
jgi:hypothetical protein